jgi:hypothetical protein
MHYFTEEFSDWESGDLFQLMGVEIFSCGAFFKDQSFKEENEWRLIGLGGGRCPKFREGKSTIVPYVDIEFDREVPPIKHVYVGPCPNPQLSELSVQSLLRRQNLLTEIQPGRWSYDVRNSGVPYRDW